MASGPEPMDVDQKTETKEIYGQDQGIIFLVVNSYSKDSQHRLLWADTALRAYAETFHNHLYFRVVPLPDVENFDEVFEELPKFADEVKANHYQYVALAFVGHGKQVHESDCLLTNISLQPIRISDIIAKFGNAFRDKIHLFFFDMCRQSDHPDPSQILPHLQLPQNSYVVFSTQCDSKAWDYAYDPERHKYSVWSEHFNDVLSTFVGASLSQVIASINRRLKSINQRAEVIDYGGIGMHVLLPGRDSREFTEEDKVALDNYKSFMNVVRLGHGPTYLIVHPLLQPFYNNVLEIIREILEHQQRSGSLACVQQFLQQYLNVSDDVIVEDIHTIFKQQSVGFYYDLDIFKLFMQEFSYPKLKEALSTFEKVQSEIRNNPHTPYHVIKVEFEVAYRTFAVQNVPVAFVLSDHSSTRNFQSGVELVKFLKRIYAGVHLAGFKEGCLMAILVFDVLLALQLPVLLHSHLPRLTDLTVTEVYISDLVRISVCNGKVTFLGSRRELKDLCVVYEEKLAVEKDPVCIKTLRFAKETMSKCEISKEPEPEMSKEPEPEMSKESEPEMSKEPEPEMSKESEPEMSKEPEPEMFKEPEPEMSKEPEPEMSKEPEPEMSKEPEPEMSKDSEGEMPKESEGEMPREPEPEMPTEFEGVGSVESERQESSHFSTVGQGEDIETIVGKDLGKVAGEIDHIVDQHSKERLDYMVYKKTVEELYGKWPNLSISDKIWALFHIEAKFLERKQSDEAVLTQFPGQAMHEIGLDRYPQNMMCLVRCSKKELMCWMKQLNLMSQ